MKFIGAVSKAVLILGAASPELTKPSKPKALNQGSCFGFRCLGLVGYINFVIHLGFKRVPL